MSVGGTVVDVVVVRPDKVWVNTIDRADLMHGGCTCAVYCNPLHERIEVGDSLWWQGGWCFWTPRTRERSDVKLPKIGFSGVNHPDKPTQPQTTPAKET